MSCADDYDAWYDDEQLLLLDEAGDLPDDLAVQLTALGPMLWHRRVWRTITEVRPGPAYQHAL